MRKKGKLYTANRFNQPLFAQGVDRERHNIFDGANSSLLSWDRVASKAYGASYGDKGFTLDDYMNSKNSFNIAKKDNPLSKGNLANTFSKQGLGNAMKGIGSGLILDAAGAIGSGIGNLTWKGFSGGHSSGVGDTIHGVTSTVGDIVGNVPIVGGFAKGALDLVGGTIGGAINGLFGGPKADEGKVRANAEGTAAYRNFTSNAGSFDAIQGPVAQANVQDAWTNSLFGGGASAKNEAARQARREAKSWAFRSVDNNIWNLQQDQINDALANYSAFGGPLDISVPSMGGAALDYGLAMDYLTMKKQQNEVKNKLGGISPVVSTFGFGGCLPQQGLFALGGDIQSNGGEYSVGKVYDVSEAEAKRLKRLGYEFTVVN